MLQFPILSHVAEETGAGYFAADFCAVFAVKTGQGVCDAAYGVIPVNIGESAAWDNILGDCFVFKQTRFAEGFSARSLFGHKVQGYFGVFAKLRNALRILFGVFFANDNASVSRLRAGELFPRSLKTDYNARFRFL